MPNSNADLSRRYRALVLGSTISPIGHDPSTAAWILNFSSDTSFSASSLFGSDPASPNGDALMFEEIDLELDADSLPTDFAFEVSNTSNESIYLRVRLNASSPTVVTGVDVDLNMSAFEATEELLVDQIQSVSSSRNAVITVPAKVKESLRSSYIYRTDFQGDRKAFMTLNLMLKSLADNQTMVFTAKVSAEYERFSAKAYPKEAIWQSSGEEPIKKPVNSFPPANTLRQIVKIPDDRPNAYMTGFAGRIDGNGALTYTGIQFQDLDQPNTDRYWLFKGTGLPSGISEGSVISGSGIQPDMFECSLVSSYGSAMTGIGLRAVNNNIANAILYEQKTALTSSTLGASALDPAISSKKFGDKNYTGWEVNYQPPQGSASILTGIALSNTHKKGASFTRVCLNTSVLVVGDMEIVEL